VLYGLVPKETRMGDVVCVLDGCTLPVVIRNKVQHWILVGSVSCMGA
jgi:hypothetical protein